MKASQLEVAQDKLADALTEHIQARLQADPLDREQARYLLSDLNGLLGAAGPGASLQLRQLRDQTLLRPHLRSALEIPAQVLARELPGRLSQWLKAEPNPASPERPQWAEHGRWLLDQARLSPSNLA